MVKKCIESINNTAKTLQKGNTLHLYIAYLSSFKKRGREGGGGTTAGVIYRCFVT
jgi:hypothetical protein